MATHDHEYFGPGTRAHRYQFSIVSSWPACPAECLTIPSETLETRNERSSAVLATMVRRMQRVGLSMTLSMPPVLFAFPFVLFVFAATMLDNPVSYTHLTLPTTPYV